MLIFADYSKEQYFQYRHIVQDIKLHFEDTVTGSRYIKLSNVFETLNFRPIVRNLDITMHKRGIPVKAEDRLTEKDIAKIMEKIKGQI